MPLTRYDTLTQPVIERASSDPERLSIVFVHDDGMEERLNAAQFHNEASHFASALQSIGVGPEDL